MIPTASNPSPAPLAPPKLRIYCMGPGVGESIVLQLPCGGWGVVDCYQREDGGTLDFLRQQKVGCLKFLCWTHPHEDHHYGAHKLLNHYTGKIENFWRFPGISKGYLINLGLTGRARSKYGGDPEASDIADDYHLLLGCLTRERNLLTDETYRQVIGPHENLLKEKLYRIDAEGPGTTAIEHFQERFAKIMIKDCPMLLGGDEGGELINSISVVLTIHFGEATIFLLADAQGPEQELHPKKPHGYTLVKIAHHGSYNGKGADIMTRQKITPHFFNHGVLTPYTRSRLPRLEMINQYKGACQKLFNTSRDSMISFIPGMINRPPASGHISWLGFEISADGRIEQFQ